MTIAAHAQASLLADYASGALCEGMGLLVACHLTYCRGCRTTVSCLETLGGALLAEQPPKPADPDGLAEALARIDAPERRFEPAPPLAPETPLPAPLRRQLAACGSALRWRFLLPGLSGHRIPGFATERVALFRARPGVRIPEHTHSGAEATLVLCGHMRDGPVELGPGDMCMADERDDHCPEVVGSDTCICLAVQSGRLRFTGPLGRIFNLLPE